MNDNNKKAIPSLASLTHARQTSTNNSLAQLKQKMQKPAASSLASLASASASNKKPLSSLQTLAQRANTTKPSLASLAHKSSSGPSSAASNSLAHLASQQTTAPVIKQGSLASLASKSSQIQTKLTALPSTPAVAPKVTTEEALQTEKKLEITEEEEPYINPLCAKPSAAAQFLFKPQQSERVFDAQDVFQKATKKPTCIHVFEFDQPSPDDIVITAQSQRSSKKA
jgi:hypothetical protein